MKQINWSIFLGVLVVELVLITLLGLRSPEDWGILLWFSLSASLLAVPTLRMKSIVGPLPGPLLFFSLAGILSLFAYYNLYAHYSGVFVIVGFLVQVFSGVLNLVGLRREI